MSFIADNHILEQIKEMRAEQAQFRREVMAELATLRRAVEDKAVSAMADAIPVAPKQVGTSARLPKFMTAPPMGERK